MSDELKQGIVYGLAMFVAFAAVTIACWVWVA